MSGICCEHLKGPFPFNQGFVRFIFGVASSKSMDSTGNCLIFHTMLIQHNIQTNPSTDFHRKISVTMFSIQMAHAMHILLLFNLFCWKKMQRRLSHEKSHLFINTFCRPREQKETWTEWKCSFEAMPNLRLSSFKYRGMLLPCYWMPPIRLLCKW